MKSIIVNSVIGTKENLTLTIFVVKITATIFNFNSSQYFLAISRQFYISFTQIFGYKHCHSNSFRYHNKYSFKSDKHPVILTAYVVIYHTFQKCDACRSVIQKLYNIYNFILKMSSFEIFAVKTTATIFNFICDSCHIDSKCCHFK